MDALPLTCHPSATPIAREAPAESPSHRGKGPRSPRGRPPRGPSARRVCDCGAPSREGGCCGSARARAPLRRGAGVARVRRAQCPADGRHAALDTWRKTTMVRTEPRGTTVELILGERDRLLNVARRLTRCEHDAQDLVQDTMLRAYRARARFQPGTSVRAWTTTILRRVFLTGALRSRRRGVETDTDLGGPIDRTAGDATESS